MKPRLVTLTRDEAKVIAHELNQAWHFQQNMGSMANVYSAASLQRGRQLLAAQIIDARRFWR